jgi:two-component system response regulator FlrC
MTGSVIVLPRDDVEGQQIREQIDAAGYQGVCVADPQQAVAELVRRNPGLCLSHAVHAAALLPHGRRAAPLTPIVVLDHRDDVRTAVSVMRGGAVDSVNVAAVDSDLLTTVQEHFRAGVGDGVIKASASSERSFELASRVAQTDVSVLVLGESGTGKEVIARFIHRASRRADGPFVAINCAAIPDNMLEAMLFGHMKGAFTGAHQSQPGKFELANGGTLLLDEISELPLALQAKLFRVLQEREVERVGARSAVPVDVRVIATSNIDVKAAIAEGRFREDLYYRLSVFPLKLEPLRRRPEDILELAHHFAAKHRHLRPASAVDISSAAESALQAYAWPGNVRELENTVQRALVLATGPGIDIADLGLVEASGEESNGLSSQIKDTEGQLILDALRANQGQRKRTADQLGISERTLRYKLARMREAGVEEV